MFSLRQLINSADRAKLWTIVNGTFKKGSLMGCAINGDPNILEARMSNGLVKGHAYSITNVVDLRGMFGGDDKLLRLRNPWGGKLPFEWNGGWSDNSIEWQSITDQDKRSIGLTFQKDGEFWISYDDFMRNYDFIQMCHLSGHHLSEELLEPDDDRDLTWKCTLFHSAWVSGESAGGPSYNPTMYLTNPQFLITLEDVDNNDNLNKADVIIALMQKDSRLKRMRTFQKSAEEFIQFTVYKVRNGVPVDESKQSRIRFYGDQLESPESSGPYTNLREVTKRFRLDPGHYVIIPSTNQPYRDSEFILRVYTETPIDARCMHYHREELVEENFALESVGQVPEEEWKTYLNPKCHRYGNPSELEFGIDFSSYGDEYNSTSYYENE